jgi:hypothetical protein
MITKGDRLFAIDPRVPSALLAGAGAVMTDCGA